MATGKREKKNGWPMIGLCLVYKNVDINIAQGKPGWSQRGASAWNRSWKKRTNSSGRKVRHFI